jgi:hypothetical protein
MKGLLVTGTHDVSMPLSVHVTIHCSVAVQPAHVLCCSMAMLQAENPLILKCNKPSQTATKQQLKQHSMQHNSMHCCHATSASHSMWLLALLMVVIVRTFSRPPAQLLP